MIGIIVGGVGFIILFVVLVVVLVLLLRRRNRRNEKPQIPMLLKRISSISDLGKSQFIELLKFDEVWEINYNELVFGYGYNNINNNNT